MALSGTINGSTSNKYIDSKVVWSATQDITGNYSTVTATLYYSRNNTGYTTYGTWKGSITINGTTVSASKVLTITYNSNTVAISATVKVPHNADGSKQCSISATGAMNHTSLSSTKLSGTVTLNNIPRQANLTSAPNFNDEANPTITYSNPAGNAVNSLQACIANSNGSTIYAAYRDISKTGSSYTFNLTTAERTALRNATKNSNTMSVRFFVKTVIGSQTYYSTLTKTLTIVNANPTLTVSVTDTNANTVALTGDNNKLIKYYSNASFVNTATAKKGATISSRKVTCGAKSSTSASGTLKAVESGSFTFTTTDSRGNTTTKTLTKTIVNYIKPTINIGNEKPDVSGNFNMKVSGNYFNGSFGAVSNTLAVEYRYKEQGGTYTSWAAITHTISSNTYTAAVAITGLDYQKTYVFQARIIDKLNTISSGEKVIRTLPVFDWSENDFNFNVPVNFSKGFTGTQKILWQGGYTMNDTQTVKLAEPISKQTNGIVLVFSLYRNGVPGDVSINSFFVSKKEVELLPNAPHTFFMMINSGFSNIGAKYIYITDEQLTGHATNATSGTKNNLTYANNSYVLRYVIGV